MGCVGFKSLMETCFDERENEYDMTPIKNLPVIFVNGVPGAGNQTVARTISEITGYTMIRPGDLVRAESEKGTPRGRLIADRLKMQDEIPEQLTVDLIKEEMLQNRECKGFILVGFPKTSKMSNLFSSQVKWPEKILALEVDSETAAARLQAKLSEMGTPESDIDTARQIVKTAASKVKSVHKRFGGHIVTMDKSDKALANTLEEILSDLLEKPDTKKQSEIPMESTSQENPDSQESQESPESHESLVRQESHVEQERQEQPRLVEVADG